MHRRKAFTLIELMVVIAIIAALAAILVPVVAGIMEKARFVKCGANLKTLGQSFKMYEYDTKQGGLFPSLVPAGSTLPDVSVVNATYPSDATVVDDWKNAANLGYWPMQQVWPLIQAGYVNTAIFHCQADSGWQARQSDHPYGWTALTDVSYGIQYPFQGYTSGSSPYPNPGWPGNKSRLDLLVIMADRNPGGTVGQAGKSHSNHPDIGCNAMNAIGNVVQYDNSSDSKAGIKGNDIYVTDTSLGSTTTGTVIAGFPRSNEDTVITPLISR